MFIDRQYMPRKPEKYGLKFWLLTCILSHRNVWNIQPHLGKATGAAPGQNQGMRVALDLVKGLRGHNRWTILSPRTIYARSCYG